MTLNQNLLALGQLLRWSPSLLFIINLLQPEHLQNSVKNSSAFTLTASIKSSAISHTISGSASEFRIWTWLTATWAGFFMGAAKKMLSFEETKFSDIKICKIWSTYHWTCEPLALSHAPPSRNAGQSESVVKLEVPLPALQSTNYKLVSQEVSIE